VLLLDEPEHALDTAGKEWLTSLVTRSTEAGAAVVLIGQSTVDANAALGLLVIGRALNLGGCSSPGARFGSAQAVSRPAPAADDLRQPGRH
jgi:ABC-type protease/lipase transport system fused ATPase/permease subunit